MRSHALLAAALAAMFWLGGCGGGTANVASLRTASHKVFSFNVAADSKTVHERILLRARTRYVFVGVPTLQPGVSGEFSPEDQSGTITLWNGGGVSIRYRLSATIQAIDENHAQVDLYAAGKSDRAEARLWVGWANTTIEDTSASPPSQPQ